MGPTDSVDFLEARIAEQESAIHEGSFVLRISDDHEDGSEDKSSLGERMLAECAQKRAIIASWKEAADAEGINGKARRVRPSYRQTRWQTEPTAVAEAKDLIIPTVGRGER